MKNILLITMAFLVSLTFGCAQPQTKESLIIHGGNYTAKDIKERVISRAISDGWRIEKESEHSLVIVKENNTPAGQLLLGGKHGSPYWRDSINIVQHNDKIFLSVHEDNIAEYGTGHEQIWPTNGGSEAVRQIKKDLDEKGMNCTIQ